MISQDMRNLALSFGALGAGCSTVTLTAEEFITLALNLDDLADRTAQLEAVVMPAQVRPLPFGTGGNVVPLPRSKPWGGNPPGSDRRGGPPEGGAA